MVQNSSSVDEQQDIPVVTEPYIPPVVVECSNDDIHKGNLILVNRDYEYKDGSNENLINIYAAKSDSYYVNTVDMMLDREMVNAINSMLEDFEAETGISDILANSGYRSYYEQKILYDNDIEATGMSTSVLVAPPGNSEHHTGYAMDFAINDGYSYPALRNEGEYTWIYDNAYKYGMFLRYTEENSHITGYMAESWHFRYVGTTHAALIRRIGVSYEEYISFLKDFSFEAPLEYKYDEENFYKIYYVPADTEAGKTEIPITFEAYTSEYPDAYNISGNNIDGFIVTMRVPELSADYNEAVLDMFSPQKDTSVTNTDTDTDTDTEYEHSEDMTDGISENEVTGENSGEDTGDNTEE